MGSLVTIIMPIVRHMATAAATYLVTTGWIDSAMQETAAGFVLAGASLAFSIWDKQKAKKAVEAAKTGQ